MSEINGSDRLIELGHLDPAGLPVLEEELSIHNGKATIVSVYGYEVPDDIHPIDQIEMSTVFGLMRDIGRSYALREDIGVGVMGICAAAEIRRQEEHPDQILFMAYKQYFSREQIDPKVVQIVEAINRSLNVLHSAYSLEVPTIG